MRAATLHQAQAIDKSAAIELPGGVFKCKSCEDFTCTGRIPFEQHIVGQKHLKNVQRSKESSPKSNSEASSLVVKSPTLTVPTSPASAVVAANMSDALLQPDGITYKCKMCEDFFCSGPIPMEAHLKGKLHLKNVARKLPMIEHLSIASPQRPKIDLITTTSVISVEDRVEKAWKHQTICGYTYDDSFSQLPLETKIQNLSPHFAFISKDEPIPNLVKYLSM